MKILHVITGLPKAAGTSVFCGEVTNGLSAMGHDVTIAVVNPDAPNLYPLDERVKLTSISSILTTNQLMTNDYNVVHIHGLWSPLLHKVSNWAKANKMPVVWSPHGMLTPWAMHNKWWKKYLAWWLYQRRDLVRADIIHATADSEVEDVGRIGLKNRVIVVPLGVKICDYVARVVRADGKKVLLFVSRVQRKKGLGNLVRAWAQLSFEIKRKWVVRIVGPDQEGHTPELKSLCAELDVAQDFEFVGPKYGNELAQEYASADIFVLPTYSENFGSVVIEALSHSVPVICTKGAPWQELEERKCGWWIDIGVESLADTLKDAMSLGDVQRREMGVRGRKLVEENYTWKAVVNAMVKGYEEILNGRT